MLRIAGRGRSFSGQDAHKPAHGNFALRLVGLRRLSIIILKEPAKPLPAGDGPVVDAHLLDGIDQVIAESLMIAFMMIVLHELVDRCSQRLLSEEDHTAQATLFDGAHKPLRVRVQIRPSGL